MKSIKNLVILFCGVILVSSCTSFEENLNPLIGTWTLKGVSCQNCIDKSQITSATYSCNESGCNTYTFTADGKLKVEESKNGITKTTEGAYTISGRTVTMHVNDPNASATWSYSFDLNGSMLYLQEVVEEYSGKCGATTVLGK